MQRHTATAQEEVKGKRRLFVVNYDVISVFYISFSSSHINTLFLMQCHETYSVFRVDH